MSNKFKDIYQLLSTEQKNKFLHWATTTYGRRATSIKTHWIGMGTPPRQWEDDVYAELERIQKEG